MRILILSDRIPPENSGGAEKVAWSVARGLHEAGQEVHVIAATQDPYFEEIRYDIPTYHIPVRYPSRFQAYFCLYNPTVWRTLSKLYQQIAPDIISAFNIHSDLTYASMTLAHRMNIPVVFSSQDVMAFSYTKLTHYIRADRCTFTQEEYRLPPFYNLRKMRLRYNPLRNMVIRHILKNHANVKIAGSEVHRQTLTANGLHDFRVVHASVPEEDFHIPVETRPTQIEALKARLGLSSKKVILFAGRLTVDKGSPQVLEVLDRLVKMIPSAVLLTLTRASLEQQGLNVPEYQHLRQHICVGGWMQGEELAAAYHSADVVIVPSTCMDTFPTVNLEAMACAKPVIATCFGGSAEAVIDGETGYIVNPLDIDQFENRLYKLLTDVPLAQKMGEAGYERYKVLYTPERHTREMLTVYQQLLS